jgi:uncharacterized protein (TIGR02453 family)
VPRHFSSSLFTFLRELDANNDREWFEANKERYIDEVRDPLLSFIADFAPRLEKISSNFVADPRPNGGSMFRIYRDVRFSKDKRPYKTAASAHFRHRRAKDVHTPGFYLHLQPGSVFVGSGIWRPDGPSLKKIRDAIVSDPSRWRKVTAAKAIKAGGLQGESLKRPPRGYDAEHPLVEDLKRKDFITSVSLTERDVVRDDFMRAFATACRGTRPLMQFLTDALDLDW